MKPADFLLLKGSPENFIEDAIALVERSPFTHVVSATSESTYLNPTWPHIIEQFGVLTDAPPLQFLVSPNLTDAERAAVAKQLRKFIGKHYGVVAFLWAGLCIICPPLRHVHDPIFTAGSVCSTSLAWAYYKAGCYEKLRLGNQAPESVSPADLARAWNLK